MKSILEPSALEVLAGLVERVGRIQVQSAGERPEFGSQTRLRLANLVELRGFLSLGKPGRFARTGWWAMQGSNLRPLPCVVGVVMRTRGERTLAGPQFNRTVNLIMRDTADPDYPLPRSLA